MLVWDLEFRIKLPAPVLARGDPWVFCTLFHVGMGSGVSDSAHALAGGDPWENTCGCLRSSSMLHNIPMQMAPHKFMTLQWVSMDPSPPCTLSTIGSILRGTHSL